MAKKDPTDLTVEEKLKALYQLQTTLSAIDEKRALRGKPEGKGAHGCEKGRNRFCVSELQSDR